MMEGGSSVKKRGTVQRQDHGFSQLIFSWSLDDILNEELYKFQVEKIPLTFQSKGHYLSSFVYPLLEETRSELASSMEMMHRAPFAEFFSFSLAKNKEKMLYDVTVGSWRNRKSERGKEPYRTLPGDLFILADGKPESVNDLHRIGRTWCFALVSRVADDDTEDVSTPVPFKVKVSQQIEFQDGMFVVFLMNITTHKRIWNSLHMHGNLNLIKEVLCSDSVVKENCDICSFGCNDRFSQEIDPHLLSKLNESQREAIITSICKTECCHKSFVEQIWGPPGTGKTTTVSVMLFILLQMNRRTLTCAPTNVAIVQVASRVLKLVRESFETITASGDSFCCVGDVLLFGNKERLKVSSDIEDIYLEKRVQRLTECLGSLTGWKHCIRSMIDLLEDCVSQYHVYVENELFQEERLAKENQTKPNKVKVKSFIEFVQDRFSAAALPLRRCIVTFCTHIPRSFMREDNFQNMVSLLDNLSSLESMLFQENLVSEKLEQIFTIKPLQADFVEFEHMLSINSFRVASVSILKTLQTSLEGLGLPSVLNKHAIMDFCFERASLIFCTASSSYKLDTVKMERLNLLVIDEAAQLKEAESTIPLQLPGMKHAILIGDECQLPAMVNSNVSMDSGFGRSLFDRLSSLGHSKHLLNVQYRMHPSISYFPNWNFYENQLLDAENVTCRSYEKRYLSGPMFGPYSFINVVGGREEKDDDGKSQRNMVEVAIVIKIVQNLYRAWNDSKKKLTIGIVSPYAAQVVSIQEKLGHKFEKHEGFSVKVKSIDGFQGGEEDIIILSTVRSNRHGSVGFLSSPQRTNVAVTRARHCLWILGNERTLASSDSVWKELVCDARSRHCLYDADADECLKNIIIAAKKELEQLDDLVDGNSVLFKDEKWKVLFSDDFRRSFGKLTSSSLKKLVLNLLLKLSGGWRPKNRSVDLHCENSSQILKQFKVEGFYVICTIDIVKEFTYVQVLKVWDVLPLEEIPKLTKRLDNIFAAYTDDYINLCTAKCLEGNLEIPRSWPTTQEIIRFRNPSNCEGDGEVSINPGDGRSYVENSKVSESLLLMKFYSLSSGVVHHLLSGKEHDLPMQVTDEQMDIISFRKSSFIIGQSGTGKTTILTRKLFQNEQSFCVASEGFLAAESSQTRDAKVDGPEEGKPIVRRQLFVTVSQKLCYAVKQHVSHITSIACNRNSSIQINLDDGDITSEFKDMPDTFVDLPRKNYPLVITFLKFLMMLDGTLGNSFFERFHEARVLSLGSHISSRSVALQTFIRSKKVTFERFCSLYWPHFNSSLTKKLDPSRVFTEIISHIKGGLQAGESCDGKLSYEGYLLLSEGRASSLTEEKREMIYNIFQAYEKMKTERGEFDMGDFVNDIHHRLKNGNYEGDQMDFVYIDEVQDLSMRQISLFKYICQNVDEGYVFAGDTAQTIARGIDFRFQDIRSLFYKEFLSNRTTDKQEKGLVSEIFQLKQNFRTHAGVLELAQSIIEILYCYFAHSIDILEPETSLISGEAPVLLESGNDENAIVTIFGGSGSGGEIVGFGAEQVILVRDDGAKAEICEYVGKHALVLTIVECKGLEFQDVLLYNFFGTSPLKDQWRVIYGYMKERNWLDEKVIPSFPIFNVARHNVLCSELKQLYVAVTRTRQRLWICENKEELSKPMFDYWKRRGLVQVRKLDDSVAQAMRVASSPQEWRERGKKLFYENNFVMATMCFERAGDVMWETLSKASGRRTYAEQMRETNPEAALGYLREAAEMFESIGKHESVASCYYDLGEFERAGKIYLDKCGQTEAAAECFTRAGCFGDAAKAYAKGNQIANCLSVCKTGKLFDEGIQYIEYWKEHVTVRNIEIAQIEQEFLESCACDYHERKDPKSMMKFVRAFLSMESKRVFLRSLNYLDELLLLEEESGHFLDAAELARPWGDVLKEADLLGKAGCCLEATLLILWYMFFNSLWGNGNSGWPLKQFPQKEELCNKAKSLAEKESLDFYDIVCSELNLLFDQQISLSELKKHLQTSQKHKSLRGEILSIRKILDAHFHLNSSKYDWEDELPIDIHKYCEDKIFQNQVSVRTLVFYWNLWKEDVMDIFHSLKSLDNEEPDEHVDYCLNYFGVRKHSVKGNMVYLLVNKDVDWVRKAGHKGLHEDGKRLIFDRRQLVCAIQSYWQLELLSVGIKVLHTLEALHKFVLKGSLYHQSIALLHIFEVSKSLLDCQYLKLTPHNTKTLQNFLKISLKLKDSIYMMKFVRAFSSMESKRVFLRSLNCLDELLLLEEESGHFLDAAELARSWGDVRKEADLLGKAGHHMEATSLILWYMFFSSLWGNGNSGWPLKQFPQKEELNNKAKSLAQKDSDDFYVFVCSELKLLSDQQISLSELKKHLQNSKHHKSLRGEILSVRKILDAHFHLNSSKYDWEDDLPTDITRHCEDKIFQNQASVRTLVFYWNMWKEDVMDILQSLGSLDNEEPNEHVDFSLNYFGVRKHNVKGNMVYLLVNKDADWIRKAGHKGLHEDGKRLTFDRRQLACAIQSYWQLELFSVGIKVLNKLQDLHKLASKGSTFHQSTSLLHIFEVSKSLLDCRYLKHNSWNTKTLQNFLGISSSYFDLVFPLDWRSSVSEDLISLRETELSLNLLEEIILRNVNIKGGLSYWTIGRVMMICLGSRKPVALYERIIAGLQWNPSWKSFVEKFWNGDLKDVYVAPELLNALEDTYRANWRHPGYISPHSFVYLLEFLLFIAFFSTRIFFNTKSAFVGWISHFHLTSTPNTLPSLMMDQMFSQRVVDFIVGIVQQILCNKQDTISWIQGSKIPHFYLPLLVLKLIMILCLICLQVPDCSRVLPDCSRVLHDLLFGMNNISYLLPKKFVYDLTRRRKGRYLNLNPAIVAEAFRSIEDPLMIVNSENSISRVDAPCAIFVDLRRSKEEIMSVLFPRKTTSCEQTSPNNDVCGTIPEPPSSNTLPDANLDVNPMGELKGELEINWKVLEEISEVINGNKGEALSLLSVEARIKNELDKNIHTLANALEDDKFCAGKDTALVRDANHAFDDLKLLSSAFDTSGNKVGVSIVMSDEMKTVVERLQSSRSMVDAFLNQSLIGQESKLVSESSSTAEVEEIGDEGSNGDPSSMEEVKGKPGSSQDAKNKNGKGKNGKKHKGKKK